PRLDRKNPRALRASLNDARVDPRRRTDDRVRGTERIRRTVEPRDEPVALLRKGEHLERRLDDHAEGPKRSDEELVEVVSRDVLDDASTCARVRSVRRTHIADIGLRARTNYPDGAVVARGLHEETRALGGVRGDGPRHGRGHGAVDAKANSRQRLGVGKILPGFMRPAGSNAFLSRR